ncbi:MAG: hypothetical protein HQK60_18260 [Deltaproteobacteria bacterium]|nr:hypothetical protein [Deltaproteobacteria bacterium]
MLYHVGRIKAIQLNGTYKQMGRQYGRLLSADMRGMYNEIINQYTVNKIISSRSQLDDFSKNLFQLYPQRFQSLAQGISETSGLKLAELATINEFFDYILYRGPGTPAAPESKAHCSGIAVWGDYTGQGPLVMGRNFDFPNFYKKFDPYLVVVVFNPTDGSRPSAILAYAGQIGAVQAFNDAGLVIENNDGSNSGDKARFFGQRIPFLIKGLEMSLDCSSLDGLDAAMKSYRIQYPLLFNVAGPDRAYCYEMTTYDVKRRGGEQDGLLVGVNHFLSPGWPTPPPDPQSYTEDSKLRHHNLVRLAEKFKGKIDAGQMMAILDIPKESGGPTPSDTNPLGANIYRFVAVPKQLKLWIKVPDYMDWTRIDLDQLFHSGNAGQ